MKRRNKLFMLTMFFLLMIIITGVTTREPVNDQRYNGYQFRALPRPIAKEPILITSAGQNTDTYIMKDVANKLMMDNYFAPLATIENLEGMSSMVMVVGYSQTGMELKEMSFLEEVTRVQELVSVVEELGLTLVTVYLRGDEMLTDQHRLLLETTVRASGYMIIVNGGNDQRYFINLAEEMAVPITIVDDVTEISEPFVSVFR